MRKSKIVFETGECVEGYQILNPLKEKIERVIFDTRIVGYEKTLSCPEYKDKIVCLSYPLIGNYGISYQDIETKDVFPSVLIISELSSIASNYRSNIPFADFILKTKISVISKIDTQYITKIVRDNCNLWASIVSFDADVKKVLCEIKEKKQSFSEEKVPFYVPEKRASVMGLRKHNIAVLNLGLKNTEMFHLASSGYGIKIINPADGDAKQQILSSNALYITSGPSHKILISQMSAFLTNIIGKLPVFGVGIGHLILGKALGGKIANSTVNHYGVNHPVVNLKKKNCIITEQMHSLILQREDLPEDIIETIHMHDGTVEGLFHEEMKAFSVSFIPQEEHFQRFFSLIEE